MRRLDEEHLVFAAVTILEEILGDLAFQLARLLSTQHAKPESLRGDGKSIMTAYKKVVVDLP
jgi:hypothetical protein